MKVTNKWFFNEGGRALPVSRAIIQAVAPFEPSWLELRREDGLPWVEIAFEEVLPPAKALALGRAIQGATGCPVRFMSLEANGVDFIVEGEFLLDEGESYSPGFLVEYGCSIEEVAAGWHLPGGGSARHLENNLDIGRAEAAVLSRFRQRLAEIDRLLGLVYTPEGAKAFLETPMQAFGGKTAAALIEEGDVEPVLAALAADYEGGGF